MNPILTWSELTKPLRWVVWLAASTLAFSIAAQDTNDLKTVIGQFESKPDAIVVKGFGNVGSIPLNPGEVEIRTRESQIIGGTEKIYGLVVEWQQDNVQHRRILVDDDELDTFINAINYLLQINYNVTRQPAFEASFTTKAGLQVIVRSDRKAGTLLAWLQFEDAPRLALTSDQMQQFSNLLQQARKKIDALRDNK
jgi:hypothetical protein